MSKKDSTSQLERFVGAITINSDGSSNLTSELCQQIEDALVFCFGRYALGAKTGTFLALDKFRPLKEEINDDEGLTEEVVNSIFKKAVVKFHTETLDEIRTILVRMHAATHSFLDQKAKSRLVELMPENYQKSLIERNGQVFWKLVIDTLASGCAHETEEVNRRFSKVKYYSLRQKPDEKELHVFKLRFDDTYRRYIAAKNPKIDDDEQARDFMWGCDPERYGSARNMLLNRKDVDGARVPLPATVTLMHAALREFIPDRSSKSGKGAAESDSLAFVYVNSADSIKSTDTKSEGGRKKDKKKKDKKPNVTTVAATEQTKKEQNKPKTPKSKSCTEMKCHLCDILGHFARDCPKKEIAMAAAKDAIAQDSKKSKKKEDSKSANTTFAWLQDMEADVGFVRANDDDDDDISLGWMIHTSTEPRPTVSLSSDARALMSNSTVLTKNNIGSDDLVFDTGSEVTGAPSARVTGVSSVHKSARALQINGVAGGSKRITDKGHLTDFGPVWIDAAFPVTLISLSDCENNGCKMRYETDVTTVDGCQCIHVTAPSGKAYQFKRLPGTSLYVHRRTELSLSLPTTVEDQKKQYSKREVEQAERARELQASLLWPNQSLLKLICRGGTLIGNPVSTKDIDNAHNIWGKPIELEKGARTKQHNSEYVPAQELDPLERRRTDLALDVFFINGISMLLCAAQISGCDRPLLVVRHIVNRTVSTLHKASRLIIGLFIKKKVVIGDISVDRESAMGAVESVLAQEGFNMTTKPDHVKRAERNIRTVKEGVRKVQSSVKFQLFGAILVSVVYFVISRLNMWPNPLRPDQYSPVENFNLRKCHYGQDIFGQCLSYVRVDAKSGETDNSMEERALEGLYLYSNSNQSGESYVLNLHTGRVVSRRLKSSDKAPMPQYVIDQLILAAAKHKQGLTFSTHRGVLSEDDDDGVVTEADRDAILDPIVPETTALQPVRLDVDTQPAVIGVQPEYRSDGMSTAEPELSIETVDAVHEIDSVPIVNVVTPQEVLQQTAEPTEESQQRQTAKSPIKAARSRAKMKVESEPSEGTRRSGRLASKPVVDHSKPIRSFRTKEAGVAYLRYSFHISLSKALRTHGREGVKAMTKEISQIDDLGCFKGVSLSPAMKKKAISSMLFFKEKYLSTGQFDKLKARLVAGGHRQDRAIYETKDISSPTVATESVYTIAGIAAAERRHVVTLDIAGAYLKGKFKDGATPIHMRLEKQVADVLCRNNPGYEHYREPDGTLYVELLKPLYGLIEAGKRWYEDITTSLKSIGFIPNPYDKCVFNRMVNGHQQTIVIHVDDLMITCKSQAANEEVVNKLREIYKEVSATEGKVHSYIGITFDFSKAGRVKLSQEGYTGDLVLHYKIDKSVRTPAADDLFVIDEESPLLSGESAVEFHTLSAKLLYLAKRTRPDILAAVSFLISRVQCPTEQDSKKAIRVLKYLYGTKNLGIVLEPGKNLVDVHAYIDASYGTHADGKSHTGVAIALGSGPVVTKSTKQKLTTKSSTEAELVALSDSASLVLGVRNFLEAQGYKVPPATVYQDNLSTMAMIEAGKPTSDKTKHISIRFFFVKDRVESGELIIKHLSTVDMIADILTKPIQGELFISLRNKLMNCEE